MASFFSPQWVSEVDAAVKAAPEVCAAAAGKQLVLEQVASDSPAGEVAYHLVVDNGTVSALPGQSDNPTVSITGPWQIYVRINKGEISPPVALLSGKARVTGQRGVLLKEQKLFAAIDRATRSVPVEY